MIAAAGTPPAPAGTSILDSKRNPPKPGEAYAAVRTPTGCTASLRRLALGLLLLGLPSARRRIPQTPPALRVNAERLQERIDRLARIGGTPQGIHPAGFHRGRPSRPGVCDPVNAGCRLGSPRGRRRQPVGAPAGTQPRAAFHCAGVPHRHRASGRGLRRGAGSDGGHRVCPGAGGAWGPDPTPAGSHCLCQRRRGNDRQPRPGGPAQCPGPGRIQP